jgi:hypothetical protein
MAGVRATAPLPPCADGKHCYEPQTEARVILLQEGVVINRSWTCDLCLFPEKLEWTLSKSKTNGTQAPRCTIVAGVRQYLTIYNPATACNAAQLVKKHGKGLLQKLERKYGEQVMLLADAAAPATTNRQTQEQTGSIRLSEVGGCEVRGGEVLLVAGGPTHGSKSAFKHLTLQFDSSAVAAKWEACLVGGTKASALHDGVPCILRLPSEQRNPLEVLFGGRPRPQVWEMLSLKAGMQFRVKDGCEWETHAAGTELFVVQDPKVDSDGELLLNYAVVGAHVGSLAVDPDELEAFESLEMTNPHVFDLCTPRFCQKCIKSLCPKEMIEREARLQERLKRSVSGAR